MERSPSDVASQAYLMANDPAMSDQVPLAGQWLLLALVYSPNKDRSGYYWPDLRRLMDMVFDHHSIFGGLAVHSSVVA